MDWPNWCIKPANLYIYSSHFLSAWGDHMWLFGSGLLLIEILPDSLQLTAIYGLSVGLTVLLFGALVGDWVDRTPRLRAVQIALILQKTFIILSVATVYGYMTYRDSSVETMEAWKRHLCYGFIIVFAVLGNLAQVARVITIERDWIVEMCTGDKDMLAHVTATMRRIDLGTMILAPIVMGQIMTHVGLKVGSIFIAGWNAVSLFIGYFLMWKVYKTVPALRKEKKSDKATELMSLKLHDDDHQKALKELQDSENGDDIHSLVTAKQDQGSKEVIVDYKGQVRNLEHFRSTLAKMDTTPRKESLDPGAQERTSCMNRVLYSFTTLYRGMKTYRRYDVHRAGLALACLYLTVLGFDGVTVGYIYTQGISESNLGLLMGGAAVVGVIGTIAYPIIRKRIGIARTGLYALASHWIFIALCVLSVFMPGSPFDPSYLSRSPTDDHLTSCQNNLTNIMKFERRGSVFRNSSGFDGSGNSSGLDIPGSRNSSGTPCPELEQTVTSSISICIFMTGIIGARFGLWIADLTITQLFLECVVETERGVINGVQTSINMLMDMTKFALVVALPKPPVFGFLAFISVCSVSTGDILYTTYSRKARGHLFHCGTSSEKRDEDAEKNDIKIVSYIQK